MYRMLCAVMLSLCLVLSLTACAEDVQEPTVMPTVPETEEAVTEPAPETTEAAAPQLLEHPQPGKICVSFLPTQSGGAWRYAVIEDQEAAIAAFEKAAGAIYSDEWWIKGDRTVGLTVVYGDYWDFVESGELVYALGRVKAEDAAELYAICAETAREMGWKETVKPEQLKEIRSATLRISGKEILMAEEGAVDKLEKILSAGEYELGGTGCPFTALLDVTLESGETLTVALATDGCGVWMSEGYYYSFGSEYDSQSLYDLFGVTLEFGELKE